MTHPPVLDTDVLRRLSEQLGDDDVLRCFLRRYLSLLDRRITRLERALCEEDAAGWTDALLSLRTSSELAGARALAEQASALEEDPAPGASAPLRTGGDRRALRVGSLRELAGTTCWQLGRFLQRIDSG